LKDDNFVWGNWAGLGQRGTVKRRTYLKHRNWFWTVFWTLAALSALTGAYLAWAGMKGPQL